MRSFRTFRPQLGYLAATVLAAQSVTVQAQLEEVIVTAQLRTESLQDVPISMVAMSGETINELGLNDMEEFTANLPAVTIMNGPIGNLLFIRGVGTAGINAGIEQSVALFQDGIYLGRQQLSRAPFMDLDRIELLRGPQSILFGKNTVGGALSAHTAKPTDEFEGSVQGLYGEDDELEFIGVVSGPLTDNLRGRIAYRNYSYDGYLENVMGPDDGPAQDDETLRLSMEWDVSDTISVYTKYEHSDFKSTGLNTQLGVFANPPFTEDAAALSALNRLLVATATGGDGTEKVDKKRAVDNDGGELLGQVLPLFAGIPGFPDKKEVNDAEMDIGQINVEFMLGEHTLTSVSGYAGYDYRNTCDCDFAALPLAQTDLNEDYDQYSQEIRLTSPMGGTFEYITGIYYHDAQLHSNNDTAAGAFLLAPDLGIVPNVSYTGDFEQEQTLWAVFGSLTWNFTDLMRGTLGLRYSDEEKEVDSRLDKSFTGGWDYSAFGGDEGVFGDTVAEYNRFNTTIPELSGLLDALLWEDALGVVEHVIDNRKRSEDFVDWYVNLEYDLGDDTLL